ncbi:isochorismatase family protein [Yoonia vestfoldensis]|jgi:maleamate amidohydrolase|uniref:Maleamate amidohydrolase n=1 Tax=Yoonia vestfoldensis TaxID=245188 RepID=A0A1Y0EDR1_9RHOB|nr:isochorismatase family protein [Yoonia vestfoldensis]ARU01743.1 maleamate amidohydrolase [Yoonia vestfoldensis]
MTDLQQNYAHVYNNSVGFGRYPCLILIDFAQAYFDPDCPLYAEVDSALASALRLRKTAQTANIPIVLTKMTYDVAGVTGGRFFEKAKPLEAFLPGRATGEFAKGLVPQPTEIVVEKQYPSAFFGTSLASTLICLGCDSVLLTGLTTSGCVRASCVDAMSHGFRTIVVADACGDRHDAPHQANLFDMKAKYADVVSEAAALEHLATLVTRG